MVQVRPDEVSAILRAQLANASSEAELEEVGTVLHKCSFVYCIAHERLLLHRTILFPGSF